VCKNKVNCFIEIFIIFILYFFFKNTHHFVKTITFLVSQYLGRKTPIFQPSLAPLLSNDISLSFNFLVVNLCYFIASKA